MTSDYETTPELVKGLLGEIIHFVNKINIIIYEIIRHAQRSR